MFFLKKILVPTDLEDPTSVLRALMLAKPFRAEVFVLHLTKHAEAEQEWDLNRFRQWLGEGAALCGESLDALIGNLRFECLTIGEDTPAEAAVMFARHYRFDLIVMGTRARKGLSRLLNGSVTEEVVRKAPCPVLTYHLDEASSLPCALRHILVPTDFSDCSQHALMHAKELAAMFGARITLLHVVRHRNPLSALDDPMYQHLLSKMTHPGFLEERLRALDAAVPGPDIEVACRIAHGDVAERIATFAEDEEVDLITLATHGITGIRHFLMGSVSEKVIRLSRRPVFTVKSFGRSLVAATPASFKQPETANFFQVLRFPLEDLPHASSRPHATEAPPSPVLIRPSKTTDPALDKHPVPLKEPHAKRPPVSHSG